MELTPEQRDRIQQVLRRELMDAYRSAFEHGAAPADVAELLDERQRAVESLIRPVAEDVEHLADEGSESSGVGEQG